MDELNLCRLCFTRNENSINIFDENGRNLNIAHILTKHFWFQVREHDDYSDKICSNCWQTIQSFHFFYTSIETIQKEHQRLSNYTSNENKDYLKLNIKSEIAFIDTIKYEDDNSVDNISVRADPTASSDEEKVSNLRISRDLRNTSSVVSKAKSAKTKKVQNNKVDRVRKLSKKSEEESVLKKAELEKEDEQIRKLFQMECIVCEHKFETFLHAKDHYQTVHADNKGYLVCCDRKFYTRGTVIDHVKFHTNPEMFKCETCAKVCLNRSMLRKHIRNYHTTNRIKGDKSTDIVGHTEEGNFGCDICGKFYRTKNILGCHIRGIHQRSYHQMCDICARVFKSKAALLSHQKIHTTGPQKIQCKLCGAWLSADSIRCHMVTSHKNDPVKCQLCDKISPNKYALKKHMRYVHSERSHKCAMCEKSFKLAVELKEHVASHTGETLYTCAYCPKTFQNSANMYRHRKASHIFEWKRDHSRFNTDRFI